MTRDDAYDLIDRFLRNMCDDNLYAEYSEALDLCFTDESLRQQLAAMEDKYLVERGMLRLKRAEFEDSQKREVMLRDALWNQLNDCINFNGGRLTTCIMEASTEALAATDDLSGLILCEKEPIGSVSLVVSPDVYWGGKLYKANPSYYLGAAFYKPVTNGDPLYRAWEPK